MTQRLKLECFFDGSIGPTATGTAAYGFVIKDSGTGDPVYSSYGLVGRGPLQSVNTAEYEGLYQAMTYIVEHHPDADVQFYGDSQLVIEQMAGRASAKRGRYLPYYRKTMLLASAYILSGQWQFAWIPRALNSEADDLAQYSRYPNN